MMVAMKTAQKTFNTGVTVAIAEHVAHASWDDLPEDARRKALQTAVNSLGCVLGGAAHPATEACLNFALPLSGRPTANVLGRSLCLDASRAALINCLAGTVHAFDDTHAHSLVHPGTPVTTAALATAESAGVPLPGSELLTAIAWGVEVTCRISKAISPHMPMALQQTGTVGTIGAAISAGLVLKLDPERLGCAIGLAASMASGIRAGHGTTAMHLLHARAASCGVEAAFLASSGIDSAPEMLDGKHGFLAAFAPAAESWQIVDGLGARFELLANTFKPYPCGAVIHPVIDCCLEVRERLVAAPAAIEQVAMIVASASVALADRPQPKTDVEAILSLQHWAAAALVRGKAGVAEGDYQAVTADRDIAELRMMCRVEADAYMAVDSARIEVHLADGNILTAVTEHCRGSLHRPMEDDELSQKFVNQAARTIGLVEARRALAACWGLASAPDVAAFARDLAG